MPLSNSFDANIIRIYYLLAVVCLSTMATAGDSATTNRPLASKHEVISVWREAMKSSTNIPRISHDDTERPLEEQWIATPIGQIHLERLWRFASANDVTSGQVRDYSSSLISSLHMVPNEHLMAMTMPLGSEADRWDFARQRTWQDIATYYEEKKDYGSAIAALKQWHVSEPCGTGAGFSNVRRWTWLLRLRIKNRENIDELREYAWRSLRTGELESIWHPTGVADCMVELYKNDYDVLMADAHKTLAMLEAEETDEQHSQWRRKEIMAVVNHISLRMRLAGPEWRMAAEEARNRQRKQADSSHSLVEKTVRFGEVPMVFMFIPSGEFLIGSPPDEKGRIPPDEDQDRVQITRPFYMGKYEVTQLQWQNAMGSNPSHFKGKPDSPMRPVDSISWNDIVQQFLPKIQQYALPGMRFDLPTEAQWEYACRAGADMPFHFGETPDYKSANIGEIIEKHTGRWATMPVGSFPSNAWGLHDMHGNVQEWCKDTFSHNYYRSHNAVAVDPINEGGRGRVMRGGGYSYSSRLDRSRSACRLNDTPDRRVAGFRLVLLTHEGNENDTEQKDALDEE